MVIVIISKGISSKPIIPSMKNAAIKFGTTPIKDNLIFLNRIKNIIKIPIITNPKVSICDLNKLCNKLLNKIKDYNKTLQLCHSTVGVAILNTSITIVFGFSILVLSKFIPTIYFGMFTGLAMLLAMISVLTLLPALILIIKPFGKSA